MIATRLSNGQLIPPIGLGTWQVKGGQIKTVIKEAIKLGYRHLDCAAIYENEQEVGQALQDTIDEGFLERSDVIKSSIWSF